MGEGTGAEGVRTVGAVDLGGSSLEVSFVPDEATDDASQGKTAMFGDVHLALLLLLPFLLLLVC